MLAAGRPRPQDLAMPDRPLRCSACGATDFFVISGGASYRAGTIVETYRWPEQEDELEGAREIEEALAPHVHDHGYHVEQEVLVEPELDSIEGPVKALCSACFTDMTEPYLQMGRPENLPV